MGKHIDGYLVDDLIVYRGLQKGGYVGRGFRIYPPDAENADIDWLNHLEDELRVLLASLKDTVRMQFHWSVDSDYQRELLNYYEQTKALADNEWSRQQRNERFTRYWEKMENRQLRRERLNLYVTSKIDAGALPSNGSKREVYDAVLNTCGRELDQYGELLTQIFGGLGGSVETLGELDHFEEFYRYFNPSAPDCTDIDYGTLYDPEKSLIDNCFNGEGAPLSKPDQGFILDGYHHGILAVKSLPKTTFSGMIGQLTGLDMLDYSITVNVSPLDVLKEIEKEEGAYEKLQNTIQHSPKLRMLAAMQKKGAKISRLMSNEVLPYKAQFIVRCWDQDKAGLRAKLAALRSAISKLGGATYYDPALPTSARNYYYAAIPGWCWDKYDDHAHYIEDANLADLLPVSATPTGDLADAEALYDGANGNLVGLKTFAGLPGSESPQHGVMFGMSGAGKSVNMIDLLTQTEPYYDYTVIVEEGLSYGIYTQTVEPDAKPIIIQPNGTLTFNYLDTNGLPLTSLQLANASALGQLMAGASKDEDKNRLRGACLSSAIRQLYRDTYDDWKRRNPDGHYELVRDTVELQHWLASKMPAGSTMLDAFVDHRDYSWQNGERETWRKRIDDELIDHAQQDPALQEETFRLAFARFPAKTMPTHSQLQEGLVMGGSEHGGEQSHALAQLLEPWCSHGSYGAILDGENNVNIDGKIAHFELGYIPESAQDLRAVAAFLITNHARSEVMTRPRSVRKRVILEELSAFLTVPNGDRITREFYERMRKYNCWVFSVIQQFGRFYDSPVRSSVMGNSRLLMLLKQRDRQDLDRISEAFPLPEVTRSAIGQFPEPRQFSSFVYYREDDRKPVIAHGRNQASPEMLYATASDGATFDRRAKALQSGKASLVEKINAQARP